MSKHEQPEKREQRERHPERERPAGRGPQDEPDEPDEEAEPVRPADADPEGADGHTAKHRRPGIGREEQTRPYA
ncbi:hypothetical protein [Streptomyces sp. NPDC003327]